VWLLGQYCPKAKKFHTQAGRLQLCCDLIKYKNFPCHKGRLITLAN